MGTHPSNPSKDVETGRDLLDLLRDNQALLGSTAAAKFGRTLPFLFKVLSINKALSIQAHPNKALAEELHARDPKNYPDDNHKPEMAIALTAFEALCGFRPLTEILHFLKTVQALRDLVGEDVAMAFTNTIADYETDDRPDVVLKNREALKTLFSALMSATETSLAGATSALLEAVVTDDSGFAEGGVESSSGATLSKLIRRLYAEFGVDYGLFSLFFLNYVILGPGEGLFLRADDIHAYISGDIIECMAASDNVVRAGFTAKFKDVPTLTSMLTYNYAPIEEQKMHPVDYAYATLNRQAYSSGSESILYDPPIQEFSVVRTSLKSNGAKATLDPLAGPSIIICTEGKGKISVGPKVEEIGEGYVFFVGATAEAILEAGRLNDGEEFVTFLAFCELEDYSNGA